MLKLLEWKGDLREYIHVHSFWPDHAGTIVKNATFSFN